MFAAKDMNAQTGRPGLSHREKRELWHRWKAGQTLSEIGRALNEHAGSVRGKDTAEKLED